MLSLLKQLTFIWSCCLCRNS